MLLDEKKKKKKKERLLIPTVDGSVTFRCDGQPRQAP